MQAFAFKSLYVPLFVIAVDSCSVVDNGRSSVLDCWIIKGEGVTAWVAEGVTAWVAEGVTAWVAEGVTAWVAEGVTAWVAEGVDASIVIEGVVDIGGCGVWKEREKKGVERHYKNAQYCLLYSPPLALSLA